MRKIVPSFIVAVGLSLVTPLSQSGGTQTQPNQNITVASWNICKPTCSDSGPSWEERKTRLINTFTYANADLLGLQEVTNNATSTHPTQVADVTAMLAPLGYSYPVFDNNSNDCRRPRDENNQLAGPSPCENTAAIFYKTDRLQQVNLEAGTAGITMISKIAPVNLPESGNRSVAWALLQDKQTKVVFLAVSLHVSNSKNPVAENDRVILGNNLTAWGLNKTATLGYRDAPIILMADLNSYQARQPNGVQKILENNNWIDAFTAKIKKNPHYSTVNYSQDSSNRSGFPNKPKKFKKTKKNPEGYGTRIDYIFGYGARVKFLEYETVLFIDNKGFFIPNYQGSDHQMVKAVVTLL